MANITITAANVQKTSTTVFDRGTAGGTITAGMPLYKDSTASNTLKACDADASQAAAAIVGIALNGGASGQTIEYATGGDVDFGAATFALGTVYVCSATAGAIAPSADLDTSTATNYGSLVGIASSATNIKLAIMASGAINP